MEIRAIPTQFGGICYRSRLEARWAVFFTEMKMRFEYEPEGFDIGGDWYLPDFWLPDQEYYVEIKPALPLNQFDMPADHRDKLLGVVEYTEKNGIAIYGAPSRLNFEKSGYRIFRIFPGWDVDEDYFWCQCLGCGAVGAQYCGQWPRNKHAFGCRFENYNSTATEESGELIRAYHAALSERFDGRDYYDA